MSAISDIKSEQKVMYIGYYLTYLHNFFQNREQSKLNKKLNISVSSQLTCTKPSEQGLFLSCKSYATIKTEQKVNYLSGPLSTVKKTQKLKYTCGWLRFHNALGGLP